MPITGDTLASLGTGGAPSGWIAANQGFALTATASDQGFGVRDFRSFSPWPIAGAGSDAGTFACTGTHASLCGASVVPISLFFNSNQLPIGSNVLAVKAIDALDSESSPMTVMVRVDKSAPVVATSGSATRTNAVGPELTITATDGSPSARRSGIESITVVIEREAPLADLEVYEENLQCVEAEASCAQSVSREILLPSQAVVEGTAAKVLVEDRPGNTGIEEGSGQVPEWEIDPVPRTS